MAPGPLSAGVGELCQRLAPRLAGPTGAAVYQLRRRLDEPLRVAVAGRLKSGKSTLVNALIGRRVAPTEVGECTRVVTQFRYGTSDRIDVVRRDGTRSSLPLDDAGMIPARLGTPWADVAYVDATLTSDRLRDLIVVDTPGLSSTAAAVSDRAQAFLLGAAAPAGPAGADRPAGTTTAPIDDDLDPDSARALSGAEAIVYVFTQAVRADDVQALEAFRSVSARLASNPVNSVGVLNKIDKLAGGGDPWPVAGPLAGQQAGLLRRVVSDVVPLVGLLAETTEAGRLTAADCEALRRLAGLPAAERAVLLASVDLFTGRDCPVPAPARRRLLGLLDLYGIGLAVAELTAAPGMGTADLVAALSRASGLPRLTRTVDRALRWRADALKAGWALSGLERIGAQAGDPADRELLRDGVEELVGQPAYHRLRLLEAAQLVAGGSVALPEPLERELARLALSDDPAWVLELPAAPPHRLAGAAREAARRWRAYAVDGASPAQSRVALIAHRGFHLLSQRLTGAAR